MDDATPERLRIGLCFTCHHAKAITSGKGSRFFYCLRAENDDTYTKYPRLPVLQCPGYEAETASPAEG
ncbi:MAG: hypothetical protein HYZ50_05495 [Deltaproteobacteria bacterium]|nr:hypothetical protein [Deltaproteobacteria bacterium]